MLWSVVACRDWTVIRVLEAEKLLNASLGFLGVGEAGTRPIVAIPHIPWAFGQSLLIDILRYLHIYMSPRGYYRTGWRCTKHTESPGCSAVGGGPSVFQSVWLDDVPNPEHFHTWLCTDLGQNKANWNNFESQLLYLLASDFQITLALWTIVSCS